MWKNPNEVFLPSQYHWESFPDGADGKESACNMGYLGLIPRSGRVPGEGDGNALQYSCLENPMDRGHSPRGHKESDKTKSLILCNTKGSVFFVQSLVNL